MGSQMADDTPISCADFDDDFIWGTATSAYQIEGCALEGGRGLSIWDCFCRKRHKVTELDDKGQPIVDENGKPKTSVESTVRDGTNGNTATNAYHKMKEDVQIMKAIGLNAYRFSISWSRILPGGKLEMGINQEGVDYYDKLIDELKTNKIEPFVTLFHWDTPLALEEEYMGFLSPNIVSDFAKYAQFCFWKFGDRVTNWITLNEPWSYVLGGYVHGTFAPGRGGSTTSWLSLGKGLPSRPTVGSGTRLGSRARASGQVGDGEPGKEPYTVTRNLLLAHAQAVKIYRDNFKEIQKGKIGITLVSVWYEPYDTTVEQHVAAAKRGMDFMLGWFMQPLLDGKYPQSMIENVDSDRLQPFDDEEIGSLKGSFDFLGLNYYSSSYAMDAVPNVKPPNYLYDIKIDDTKLINAQNQPIGEQCEGASWLHVRPDGLYQLLEFINREYFKTEYGGKFDIYITENGYADKGDDVKKSFAESCNDKNRIKYFHDHLLKLKDAIKDVPVKGYFAWSFMDNFEWVDGYCVRFGIIHVDFKCGYQTRYPKDSAMWFKNFLLKKKKQEIRQKRRIDENHQTTDMLKKSKISVIN